MKRYILATVMAAIVTVPTIALATGKNILSVHILDQQTGTRCGSYTGTEKR